MFSRSTSALLSAVVLASCGDDPPSAASVAANSAITQSATVGSAVAEKPSVKVLDSKGNPFPNFPVTFSVASGGGTLTQATATTNAEGIATAGNWLLGVVAGPNTVMASAEGLSGSPVTFAATGTAGAIAQVVIAAGNNQTANAGSAVAVAPAVRLTDLHGNVVAGASITFSVATGGGSVTGGVATSNDAGIATVGSWTLGTTAGANGLVASPTAGGPAAVFAATGQVGPASRVAIQREPSGAASGAIIATQPIVRITDAVGNVIAGSTAAVTAAIATGSGTLSGTTTVNAVNGVATFTNLTITGTGPAALAFTVAGLTAATSASFTVAPPPTTPTQLAVATQPDGATSAVAFTTQPVIQIRDGNGTVVSSATTAVTASIASGSGTISGTSTVNAVNGVATFTNLAIVGSGTSTITFSASGLTSATSGNVVVAAPPVSGALPNLGDRQAVMIGSAVPTAPSITVMGPNGVVAGARVTFAVASGGGSITGASAISNSGGVATVGSWTLGTSGGLNTLTATVENLGTPVTLNASACTGGGTGYKLTLCFTSEMTASQKAAFTTAAQRWESLITGDQADINFSEGIANTACGGNAFSIAPGTIVDDLMIFASLVPIDGPSNVLGSAGPCFIRNSNKLTVAGSMRFDIADISNMEANGSFNSVILHEMGHVLGIGTLWSTLGFLQNQTSQGGPPQDTHFNGPNAIAAFNEIGGSSYAGGSKVPVENTGGSGTINGHWRESVLQNELMTGFIDAGTNPLSLLTIRSLQDIGYTVDAAGADAFSLTFAMMGGLRAVPRLHLVDDVYTGPVYVVDARGRITRRLR